MDVNYAEGENEYELDKIKIKKSTDRLAKRARNCKYRTFLDNLYLMIKNFNLIICSFFEKY